ncbi:hypothetical protein [Luteolibacter soli]|uniref:Helicase n=1 Tax=Luteolibacter soli TaxID=3135280 RepID=A0ABU9B276_9BACT
MPDSPQPITLSSFGEEPDYFEPYSSRYLVRNATGRWLPLLESGYKRHLRARGLKSKPDEGDALSDIDAAILDVQDHRDISHYGPICGKNAGLLEANGQRILVTEDLRLPEPAAGSWANLRAVLEGLLQRGEEEATGRLQVATFHGWIRSSVKALRAGELQQQQALALCGPPRCGKSFLQGIITHMLGGRGAKAERYFSGRTPFNADLYAAEHLMLEDEHCSTRIENRLKLGSSLKQHTVSTYLGSLHAKGRNAVNLPGWWRVSITLNDDPEAMMVLPPLDQHIADKIIILRASVFQWPMPMESTSDRTGFHARIVSEIPAYLHWLLHEWQAPREVIDPHRYNVATFHHPELAEALHCFSPEAELHELLQLAYADAALHRRSVEATAAEIEAAVRYRDPARADRLFSFRNACSTYLGRLVKKYPNQLEAVRDKTHRWWVIDHGFLSSQPPVTR